MVYKRDSRGEGGQGSGVPAPNHNKRHKHSAGNVPTEISLSPDDLAKLEAFIRKCAREAVDRIISKRFGLGLQSPGSSIDSVGRLHEVGLVLRFVNDLPAVLFTGSRIEAKDESPVKIELIDPRTNTRVTTGPESSAKVLIVVLNGDFDSQGEAELASNVVREREGQRPLITGDRTVNLQEGLAYLSNITFTDNSSWTRSRRFRLGAHISQKAPFQGTIKGAASNSFIVKDQRGEGYKKHYPPALKDNVWRLNRIGKDGKFHSRLAHEGINTVEDFLRLLETNPPLLRTIISPNISDREWDAIVAHAQTCVVDDSQLFFYSQESANAGLLFNSVYRVIRVTFDGQTYFGIDELNPYQMAWMQDMKQKAYASLHRLVPISWPLLALGPPQPIMGQQPNIFLSPQEPAQMLPSQGYYPATDSTLHGYEGPESHHPAVSGRQEYQSGQIFSPTAVADVWPEAFDGGICSSNHGTSDGLSAPDIHISACFPSTSVWIPENAFLFGATSDYYSQYRGGPFPSFSNFDLLIGSSEAAAQSFGISVPIAKGRSRVAWCKVRAAFRFRSMNKVAAQRRLSHPPCAV
ncbi:hypothetical protein SAY86_010480 [Trapa natans]|uniref:Uncharacterized protein n=1 Tax=Trapa natans TaxID=22666 RepID=A0AAN7R1W1_TRANT|nr:hypothetical protein SAY86_010480 [Trapa natans]